jgi:hypothetical protein
MRVLPLVATWERVRTTNEQQIRRRMDRGQELSG